MKTNIKKILREGIDKNSLGVVVTKPNQVLIIMAGVSGSGKSTKAKELVGNGIIHSTDDVIESMGDYNEFFKKMIDSKDFTPLSRAHSTNLKNAIESIKNGINPVIIDNTNLSHSEPKAYVKSALELGLSDDNIRFVDIGTGGLSAEELAKRNSHGVPLDKIKQMMDKHKSRGEMNLQTVLASKDMYNNSSNILYSAVVLENVYRNLLFSNTEQYIPDGFKKIGHHMTIAFGKPVPNKEDLGKKVLLTATHIGVSDKAIAVKVSGYPSERAIPHITIAIGPEGKPVDSNNITNWKEIKKFPLEGIVTEIKKKKDE